MSNEEELVALRARIEQLEKANKPLDWAALDREAALWKDQMHQASETRMSRASAFSREDLAAMEAATPTSTVQEIAMRDNRAPTGPSSEGVIPSSQLLSNVRVGGGGTGWRDATPLAPPPS